MSHTTAMPGHLSVAVDARSPGRSVSEAFFQAVGVHNPHDRPARQPLDMELVKNRGKRVFAMLIPTFSGQLIPKSRQGPVNIGPKIFLGRSETVGDFFLSPVFRLFNAFSRRNRPVVAPQGGGKPRSAAPEFGFNSDGLGNGSVTTTPCASRNTAASELQQHLHGVFQSGLRRPPAYEPQLRLVHEGAYAREQGVCLH